MGGGGGGMPGGFMFQSMGGGGGGGVEDMMMNMAGGGGRGGGRGGKRGRRGPEEAELPVSLEDLYRGTKKNIQITRRVNAVPSSGNNGNKAGSRVQSARLVVFSYFDRGPKTGAGVVSHIH